MVLRIAPGPLLFVLMIDDLPEVVQKSNVLLVADDVKLVRYLKSEENARRCRGILTVYDWSKNNNIIISFYAVIAAARVSYIFAVKY